MADPTTFDPKKETVFAVKKEAVPPVKKEDESPIAEEIPPESGPRRAGFDAVVAAYAVSNLIVYAAVTIFLDPSMWTYDPPAPTARPPGPLDVAVLSVPVVLAYLFLRWRGWFGWWQLVLLNVALCMTGPMFASVTNPWPVGGYMAYGAAVAFIFWAVIFWSERERPSTHTGPLQQPSVERVTAGFLIAPLSAGVVSLFDNPHPPGTWIVMCLLAYAFAIPLGLPAYLLFRRRGWTGLVQTVLAAASLNCIVGIILMVLYNPANLGPGSLLYAVYGAVVGTTFWVIARPRSLA